MKFLQLAALVTVLPLLTLLAGTGRSAVAQEVPVSPFLGEAAEWQPAHSATIQGITAVRFEAGKQVITGHFIGQHPAYSTGEAFLDLMYFPGLEVRMPVDMKTRTISLEIDVPHAFVGSSSAPNEVRLFARDWLWRSQYSIAQPITECASIPEGRRCTVTLSPTTAPSSGGSPQPGFDPGGIRIIGVRFSVNPRSAATYDGSLYITRVAVDPPLTLQPPLSLPATTPLPVFTPRDHIEVRPDGIYLNDWKWFVVGGYWQGLAYGMNFGSNAWFPKGNGIARHPNFVRVQFDYFRRSGVKVLRVGLLDDGRTMFDKEGHIIGYNETFRNDVQALLNLAHNADMKVEFVLLDYLVADKPQEVVGVWLQGRSKIITDPAFRNEFRDRFLVPFLREFGSHPAVIGFDVINEPEWLVSQEEGGDWEHRAGAPWVGEKAETPLPAATLKAFVTDCMATVRAYAPGKLVTVGVSAKFVPLVRDLDLDYFALHHQPWMGPLADSLPLLPKDRPWSLEEYPTCTITSITPNCTNPLSITGYLDQVAASGGTGALLWNLVHDVDGRAFQYWEREAKFQELRAWVDTHSERMYPTAPTVTGPGDGASLPTLSASLRWKTPPGTVQVQIQVVPLNNDGPAVNLIIGDPAVVAATSYTIEPPVLGRGNYVLLPGATYTWRVRATSKVGSITEGDPSWGRWSQSQTFSTPRPSAASITLNPVGADNVTTDTTPTLWWQESNVNIFYYEVQLSGDPNFNLDPQTATSFVYWNLVHGGTSVPINSWTVPESVALPDGTYYWRVRPRVQATPLGPDESGVDWSGVAAFTVE